MITLDELLEAEIQYIKDHKDDESMVYNEEIGEIVPYTTGDNLDFLKKRYINKHYPSAKKYYKDKSAFFESNDITELEILVLSLFEGFLSEIFRVDLVDGEVPPLLNDMWSILDNVLEKTPSFDGKLLYRFCNYTDIEKFKEKDFFQPTYFFTTTKDNWNQDCTTFIITPLSKDKTSAKALYILKNHGEENNAPENQVTFKRNTKFIIKKIENKTKNTPHKIYLKEIE